MKRPLVILATAAILGAAVFASIHLFAASEPSSAAAKPKPRAQGDERVLYGHIVSLARKGDHFEMRFDPAWFLSGVTANTAAAEDGAVERGQPVPNDNYVVEEGHRLLTYLVPTTARVTVLTKGGALNSSGFPATAITVSELAQLVEGEEPVELSEGLATGFWMHVDVDTVRSLEQQYLP